MEIAEHLTHLAADGPALAAAAEQAGWDAPVPGTDWRVRDLVTHVGGVHRWAADIVRTGAASGATDAGRDVGTGPGDAELLGWFVDGHRELLDTLRAAPPDLACFAFLPAPSPRAFWARRQAHETAVHRADAERAAGIEPDFDIGFAQDGIDEILNGFARRKNDAIDRTASVGLRATDDGDDWTISLGNQRVTADRGSAGDVDVIVAGSSTSLYLWVWNRPTRVSVAGDPAIAALWRSVQVRWG